MKPDKWVVIDTVKVYKVLGTWYGGYRDGDRWRLNSGIKEVTEDHECFYFHGYSGSCYECRKGSYGMSSYVSRIYDRLVLAAKKADTNITLLKEDTDWINLIKNEDRNSNNMV